MRRTSILIAALLIAACGGNEAKKTDDVQVTEQPAPETEPAEAAEPETTTGPMSLEEAATGEHRSADNIARNEWRNPVETLQFFGFQPDMTVVEVWPGGGWYTEVLAPAIGENGQLIAASYAPDPEDPEAYRSKGYAKYDARLKSEPVFQNVRHGMLQPPDQIDIGEPGSADLVVTFRNMHGWVNNGIDQQMFNAMFEVLKPGGTLGIVQHRAPEGADPKESAKKGYVPQAYVIEVAEKAGFQLVESSEINANPKDTKDYEEGVWTLPPSYRLKDKDRAKYEAIGESDRMTLKFTKPQA